MVKIYETAVTCSKYNAGKNMSKTDCVLTPKYTYGSTAFKTCFIFCVYRLQKCKNFILSLKINKI